MKFFVTWLKEIGHFFAFDYSSQIPVLKLSFLSATETVILLKTKQTKQKQQQKKNNIWQAIHKIQSKKSVNFFFIWKYRKIGYRNLNLSPARN